MAKYLASVRYGMMVTVENFQSDVEGLKPGMTVIIQTDRGIEWGEISSEITEIDRPVKGLGEITRIATEGDLGIIQHIREVKEPEELAFCCERIKEHNLQMKLVGAEHLFSSDKIIFYFLADGRVDFRDLVKDLARSYRARIEMRQIGVRDEARLLADYEHCGQELCCRTFLRNLEPVTMRMAKMQKTTLDPSKISGHCGRLMCCLRFEDAVYNMLRKELPKRGKFVATPQFRGEVISTDIIKQEVTIRLNDGSREIIHISEIIDQPEQRSAPRQGQQADRKGRDERRSEYRAPKNDSAQPAAGKDNESNNDKDREDNAESDEGE